MLFRNRALAVVAAEHGEAEIEQLVHRGTGAARAAAQPQHRPLRRNDARGEFVEFGIGRRARRRQRQHEIVEDRGALDRRALQVDRHLHADRTGRRRQRIHRGAGQHADRLLRRTYAIGRLGDRAQHAQLVRRIVHRAHFAIDEFRRCLAGDVQHRRAGEARLDQAADGVRRSWAGGREDHAKPAGDAGIAVGHVRAAEFAARHHEADGVAPADRIQHRDVVHRGDAERGGHAALREEFGDQIADGVITRHRGLLFVAREAGAAPFARQPSGRAMPAGSEVGAEMAASQTEKAESVPGVARGAGRVRDRQCMGCRIGTHPGRRSALPALATSSGAAAGMLGRRDGRITREESLAHARAMVRGDRPAGVGRPGEGLRRCAGGCRADHPSGRRYRPGRRLDRGCDRRSETRRCTMPGWRRSASPRRSRRRARCHFRSC